MNYYNEIDAFAAQWLRNLITAGLIPAGEVDERNICDVQPDDLAPYEQCHFFAGIGGWSYALELAGWHVPVWTGSCPCQPFSSAAHGRNVVTDLWSEWRRLIAARSPSIVFGEQTAQSGGWIDRVCDDLENMDYACGAAILPACSVGLDHARYRIFFVGHANGKSKSKLPVHAKMARLSRPECDTRRVVPPNGVSGRMAQMRAFGNAIVPQVTAEFIAAFMDL